MAVGGLPPYFRARRRRTAAAISIALASCTIAACGSGSSDSITTAAQTALPRGVVATANAVTLTGQWPLTGATLDGNAPAHPVYVVKIDNTASSAPQIGLRSADMIVEEMVEGGLTRLAVFFYSDIPGVVGPIRSMRASDVGIVKPSSGTIVASGGARPTLRILAADQVSTKTEHDGAPGFYRDDSRGVAPYNLFSRLTTLAGDPGSSWRPPPGPYLQFGSPDDFSGALPVKSIAATFSGSHTTTWRYTPQGWVRPDSFARPGDDFVADSVLLVRVNIGDAGYVDPAGNPVPVTQFYGTGRAILVHGDSALKCTWRKPYKSSPLSLSTKDGTDVRVPAGHTWIELVPNGSGTVTLGR